MDGVHHDPFHGGIVGRGPMSLLPIVTGIPACGLSTTVHAIVGMLSTNSGPAPATTIPTIPPYIPGDSCPSTTILIIPATEIQPHIPPVMHGHHTPANSGAIVDPS